LLDADADRADLELRLIKLLLEDRARVHPFAGNGGSWREADIRGLLDLECLLLRSERTWFRERVTSAFAAEMNPRPDRLFFWTAYGRNLTTQCLRSPAV
jgi:hypothetical protein